MIKTLGKLFSSEKVVDDISSGVDKMIYTKEEKADNFNTLLGLYTPFKLTQRYLAIIFCVPYALAMVLIMLCSSAVFVAGFFYPNTSPMWDNVNNMMDLMSGDYGTICITIAVFYFGGGALEGVVGRFKEKPKQ